MNQTDTLRHLAAIGRPNCLAVFMWMVAASPHPVSHRWLQAMTDLSDKTVGEALIRLQELQYVTETAQGWAIATARQGVLGEVIAALPDRDVPVPLQAGVPHALDQADDGQESRKISDSDETLISIGLKDSSLDDSLTNTNKRPAESRNFRLAPGADGKKLRGQAAHVAAVLKALALKGTERLDDDPFPPELRVCVEELVKINCPRNRAEIVVANSPWPAETIVAEIGRWKALKASADGRSIHRTGFPFLVAARIEQGEACPYAPPEKSDAAPYAGYYTLLGQPPADDEQPPAQES